MAGCSWDDVTGLGLEPREPHLQGHVARARQRTGRPLERRKISAGLVLVRTPAQAAAAGAPREYQAVLVRGRISYAFSEFVQHRYRRDRPDTVRQLVRGMTVDERIVVMSLDFTQIWAHAGGPPPAGAEAPSWRPRGATAYERLVLQQGRPAVTEAASKATLQFRRREAEFAQTWLSSDAAAAELLAYLEAARGPGETRWEFPKGKRLSPDEADLHCALREFTEETRIPADAYRLVPSFAFVESYVHMNVLYVNTYYLAVCDRPVSPRRHLALAHRDQAAEVADVKWAGLNEMRYLRGPAGRSLRPLAQVAFRHAKNYARGRAPRRPRPRWASQ